jgi:hypothetical protein
VAGDCPSRAAFLTNLRAVHDYHGAGLLAAPVDLSKIGQLDVCRHFVQVNATGTAYGMVQGAAPLCGQWLPAPTTGTANATSGQPR